LALSFCAVQLVVDMLLTNKEPLTSFETIKSADVKDLLVDNASNMDTWRSARKAMQALNLSEEVKSAVRECSVLERPDGERQPTRPHLPNPPCCRITRRLVRDAIALQSRLRRRAAWTS